MKLLRSGVFVVGLALVVAACQPLPHPFQPTQKRVTVDQLVDLGPRSGVVVLATEGAGAEVASRLAGLVAAALRDHDVPASATANPRQRFALFSSLQDLTDEGRAGEVSFVWTLVNPEGRTYVTWAQTERVSAGSWREADAATLAFVAERTAERFVALIALDPSGTPRGPPQSVAIWPVDGAPGDGRVSLTNALAAALRLRGIAVAALSEADSFVILGGMETTPVGDREQIEIRWSLVRPDGREVGTVGQSNVVPKGTLDGSWGEIAFAIADGAAEGLLALLRAPEATEPLALGF